MASAGLPAGWRGGSWSPGPALPVTAGSVKLLVFLSLEFIITNLPITLVKIFMAFGWEASKPIFKEFLLVSIVLGIVLLNDLQLKGKNTGSCIKVVPLLVTKIHVYF